MLRKLWALLLVLMTASCSCAEVFPVTSSNSSGYGSLSWAVNNVNASEGSGHIISFDRTVKNVVLPQELSIMKDVTINGSGVTLEGPGRGRLFTVTAGHATFNRITFTKGDAVSDNGGAVKIEGSNAYAEFNNCTFFNNSAGSYGGAVCVTNGSLVNRTTFTHCTIAGNQAANGGGIAVLNGEAAVLASIILGNTVSYDVYVRSNGANITGYYNIAGNSNANLGTTSRLGCTVSEVLLTNENGQLALETVNGVSVLKLSGTSIARDFIPLDGGYGLDLDETGNPRPMLSGYDAGAVEARPVPVQGVEISGVPYIQVNGTETYTITITPEDASLNTKGYPPDGIVWVSNSPSILSVDNTGKAKALSTGSAYLTAEVHGWNANGTPATVATARALRITIGEEARRPVAATMAKIDDVTMSPGRYTYVKPVVSLDINGIQFEEAKGGVNYTLTARSMRLDIVTTEIVSGDTVRLLAGEETGSCDVYVTAKPLPDGDAITERFLVTVGDGDASNDVGRSNGGGGCTLGFAGVCALIFLGRRIRRNA